MIVYSENWTSEEQYLLLYLQNTLFIIDVLNLFQSEDVADPQDFHGEIFWGGIIFDSWIFT